eukprot:3314803-Amphidinium_carterae.1
MKGCFHTLKNPLFRSGNFRICPRCWLPRLVCHGFISARRGPTLDPAGNSSDSFLGVAVGDEGLVI